MPTQTKKTAADPKAATTRKRTGKVAARPLSARAAAEQVLREAKGPMKIKAIAEQVLERKLAPGLKGKTPAATIGAQIVTDANRGGRFVKTEPGTFDLRELNPKGAKRRPQSKAAATRARHEAEQAAAADETSSDSGER